MTEGTAPAQITRRRLLGYAAAAPTLVAAVRLADAAGVAVPGGASPAGAQIAGIVDFTDAMTLAALPTQHLLVVEVTTGNRVVVRLPRAEVGQGITTAVAQIVAEEVDARLEDVDVVLEDARPELLFNQLTGGSNTIHALYGPLRNAGAGIRARLVTAAARRWGVSANRLATGDTVVTGPSGRRATYGELSVDAATIVVPAVPPVPKDPADFTVIGQPTSRIDARDIVTGRAVYTQDLPVPDALPCVVARPPTLRGTVRSVDDAAARAMPGVVAVTRIPTGVAVVGGDVRPGARGPRRPGDPVEPGAGRTSVRRRHPVAARGRGAPVRAADPGVADRRAHLRLRLRAPRPARGAQLRRRRAGRPGRAVAAVEEPDRRRPDDRPDPRSPGRPGDAARRARRRVVRATAVLRSRSRGRPGVPGGRPAGPAVVDPGRRHAPRPAPAGQPPPRPRPAPVGPGPHVRAPHGLGRPRRQPRAG